MGSIHEDTNLREEFSKLRMEVAFLKGKLDAISEERDYLRHRLEKIEKFLFNKLINIWEEE